MHRPAPSGAGDPCGAGVGHQLSARLEETRDESLRHRLLPARGAGARIGGIGVETGNLEGSPSKPVRTFFEPRRQLRRRPRQVFNLRHLLARGEVRHEFGQAQSVDPVVAPPAIENRLGSAVIKAAVDLASAADAASFDIGDFRRAEADIHPGIPVLLQYLLAGEMWGGFQRQILALLEHQDEFPCFGTHRCGHSSARTGADHNYIGSNFIRTEPALPTEDRHADNPARKDPNTR